jgi:uncharacterized protein (DUF2267 family)
MTVSSLSDVLERIRELGPFADEPGAKAALQATLAALGEQLTSDEREALAAELPDDLAKIMRTGHPSAHGGVDAFYRSVSERENRPLGVALEHAQVVCRVLAETLSATTRLRRNIGELGELFEPAEETAEPVEAQRAWNVARSDDPHAETKLSSARGLRQEQHEHTLATGRPGSNRPLSKSH